MKSLFVLILSLVISINSFADCGPSVEKDLIKKMKNHATLVKAGKIATGGVFLGVGGLVGVEIFLGFGQVIAGVAAGVAAGAIVALPVGASFVIVSKVQKHKIKNRIRTLSLIQSGEELNVLYEKLVKNHPNLSRETLAIQLNALNHTEALCDGSVSGKRRLIATPREIFQFIDQSLELMKPTISVADPS